MSYCVDFRPVPCATDERVIRRHSSIVTQPQHLTCQVIWILRARRARWVCNPDSHVYHSVFSKNNSRRIGALNCGKDVMDVYECGAVPSPASEGDHSSIARSVSTLVHWRLVVSEVDQLVLAEARV